MSVGTRCGNCGTDNKAGEDFCVKCGQPLTGAADQGLRENREAQDSGSLLAPDGKDRAGTVDEASTLPGPNVSQIPPR